MSPVLRAVLSDFASFMFRGFVYFAVVVFFPLRKESGPPAICFYLLAKRANAPVGGIHIAIPKVGSCRCITPIVCIKIKSLHISQKSPKTLHMGQSSKKDTWDIYDIKKIKKPNSGYVKQSWKDLA